MKKKLVYIASPVRAVYEEYDRANHGEHGTDTDCINDYANEGIRRVYNAGHIPISPVMIFSNIYDEFEEREEILEACKLLLSRCDEIMVIDTPYNKYSEGIKIELALAKELGITQVEY